jgi:hypothetical protein
LIGCNFRKVERIRKIRRDGWPEIQEDVRNDRLTINKAYDTIRKGELGEEENNSRKLSAGQIKVLKSVLTEETFVALEDLDGDIATSVKKAVEEFLARAGLAD